MSNAPLVDERQKSTAIAILRSGRSYEEAAEQTKLSVETVMQLWKESEANK